jgi:hypothetical protein
MLKNKGVKITKKPYVVEPKVVNPSIHVVDVWPSLGARLLKNKCSRTNT